LLGGTRELHSTISGLRLKISISDLPNTKRSTNHSIAAFGKITMGRHFQYYPVKIFLIDFGLISLQKKSEINFLPLNLELKKDYST
jgi:hypothetical protein